MGIQLLWAPPARELQLFSEAPWGLCTPTAAVRLGGAEGKAPFSAQMGAVLCSSWSLTRDCHEAPAAEAA